MKIENNRIIAEFMGWNINIPSTIPTHLHQEEQTQGNWELLFHSDWSWLMQVVERIESLGFEFFIVESRCKIAHNTDHSIETLIDFEIIGTKKEAVYKACIEFIKWYNEQKK